MTETTTIQETKVLWDKTADKLYVWDNDTKAWELFFVAADLVTNDALTDDLALKVDLEGDTMTGALQVPNIGINTTPDTTNKLAAKSSAILFDNIGNGVQFKVNKNAAGDTASVLYQTSYSGRAEVGLCGDDNFHFKVSPDGSSWIDALTLDKTSGHATFTAPSVINLNADTTVPPPYPGQVVLQQYVAKDGNNAIVQLDSFGNSSVFNARRTDGTNASPAALGSGVYIGGFTGWGWNGSAFQVATTFQSQATEAWNSGASGGAMVFKVHKTGTNTLSSSVTMYASGICNQTQTTVSGLATLPAAEIATGLQTFVTDALSPVFGATVSGGGSVFCPVYYDGTNWRCG